MIKEDTKLPSYFFDHIHLISQDPVKTAEFYEKIFGATQISKRDLGNGRIMVDLNLNETKILVSKPASDKVDTGLGHFGIRTNNLKEAVNELKAKGVKFTQEIREVRPGFKISFFIGPENVSIELQEGSI